VGILCHLDPHPDEALGQIKGDIDYKAVASQVFLATDAAKLMAEAGLTPPSTTSKSFEVMGKISIRGAGGLVKSFAIRKA